MIIENELPRLLGFQGKTIQLNPGTNKVPDDVFKRVWAEDPTMHYYYEERCINLLDDDGNELSPPKAFHKVQGDDGVERKTENVLKRAQRMAKKHLPPKQHAKVPTEDVLDRKLGDQLDDEGELRSTEPIDPTPQGGGKVPGNTNQAKATIIATTDAEQLQAWLANEERKAVKDALQARLEELASEE